MTYDELTRVATQLPPAQRLALIEALTRSLRRELPTTPAAVPISDRLEAILQAANPDSALHRLIGVAASTYATPSKDELQEEYIDYLTQKYGHDERPA
jgi:hypothetical protein